MGDPEVDLPLRKAALLELFEASKEDETIPNAHEDQYRATYKE